MSEYLSSHLHAAKYDKSQDCLVMQLTTPCVVKTNSMNNLNGQQLSGGNLNNSSIDRVLGLTKKISNLQPDRQLLSHLPKRQSIDIAWQNLSYAVPEGRHKGTSSEN